MDQLRDLCNPDNSERIYDIFAKMRIFKELTKSEIIELVLEGLSGVFAIALIIYATVNYL